MTEETTPPARSDDGNSRWDAVEVMRLRAEEARQDRDEAIANLRQSMSDDEILEEFGIDVREIEK